MDLFADVVEAPDDTLRVNQSYAERYQHNKRRVELEQLREKYGDDANAASESDSESDITEDEDGEQVTPHVDAAILRTLQRIREKHPDLYDASNRVFDDAQAALADHAFPAVQRSGGKRVTLQDYQRQQLRDALQAKDPALAYAEATTRPREQPTAPPPTHAAEQDAARNEFLAAAQGADQQDTDDLFAVRRDTDDHTYRDAIVGAVGDEDEVRDLIRDRDAPRDANDDFLLNYVLNRGWVDPDGDGGTSRDWDAEAADLDSEASFDSAADAFEHAYNFRFEDPSLAQKSFAIESFPRHTADSMRRPDDRRKKARQDRAARKKEEKETKMRELDQLKSLKRQEIADKLKKLREVSGSDNRMDGGAFENIDFDADFDPAEHDRIMQQQFDDNYYSHEGDAVKPEWDDDIEIDDILAEEAKQEKKPAEDETKLSKKERKQLKKKEKKARAKAAAGGGEDATVDADEMDADKADAHVSEADRKQRARELMDEYYNLGYEDMIGDTPTRFKYASVPKDSYGLSAVEILLADDADLNNVVGLKQLQPYRRGPKRPTNLGKRLKRFREELDAREQPQDEERPKKKRLGKKERMKRKAAQDSTATED